MFEYYTQDKKKISRKKNDLYFSFYFKHGFLYLIQQRQVCFILGIM